MKVCKFCGLNIENNRQFCSLSCRSKFFRNKDIENPLKRWTIDQKNERISKYEENPTNCIECGCKLEYQHQKNRFCSRSCSATFNNKNRKTRSIHTKKLISEGLKKFNKNNPDFSKTKRRKISFCKINFKLCTFCHKCFISANAKNNLHRKTCSNECSIRASVSNRTYQNGSRKPEKYFNKFIGQEILLESSWEVEIAKILDSNEINWVRPKPIKWIDKYNKIRYYYPDFYLTEYNMYLDPKNPFCMERDKEKMSKVEKIINVRYGDIEYIKTIIESVV